MDAELDASKADLLTSILQDELRTAFERIHEGDDKAPQRFLSEWPVMAKRIAERSRAFLSEQEVARVNDSLKEAFNRQK
jgi:hypothetical protein